MSTQNYEAALRRVFETGKPKADRTGTGTRSVLGVEIRYDLAEGFPLITSKRVPFNPIKHELLWFLQGDSSLVYLLQNNVHIWTEWPFKKYLQREKLEIPEVNSLEWKTQMKDFEQRVLEDEEFALEYGDLGPIYGVQWTHWKSAAGTVFNQISDAVDLIKKDPYSRRIIVSAWNVPEVPKMALAPCHAFFQFYVSDEGRLSCMLTQRSADMFLGVPFNLASYAQLTHMMAQQCDLDVGELVWMGGDTHIYDNHVDQVTEQLSREPRPLPRLELKGRPKDIFSYKPENFEIVDYDPWPAIKGEVAV